MTSMKEKLMKPVIVLVATATAVAMAIPAVAGGAAGQVARGKGVYETACVACHGSDGKGAVPGAPDFTKPHGVLSQSDSVLYTRIVNGYQSPDSPMAMPPKGGDSSLGDADVRAAIAYLKAEFLGRNAGR